MPTPVELVPYRAEYCDIVERGFEPVMQLGDLRYEWRRAAPRTKSPPA